MCVCVRVCVRERESVCKRETERVCVRDKEREGVCEREILSRPRQHCLGDGWVRPTERERERERQGAREKGSEREIEGRGESERERDVLIASNPCAGTKAHLQGIFLVETHPTNPKPHTLNPNP